jgi:hypothetical protein
MTESRDKRMAGSSNMDMKANSIQTEVDLDPQEIAAFLESRIDPRARAELIERLAASPIAAAIVADASALSAELNSEETHAASAPHRFRAIRWLAVAAGLVGIGILAWMATGRRPRASSAAAPNAMLLAQGSRVSALPGGWDSEPWGAYRGGASVASDNARAARIGALFVDLEIALRTRDERAGALARHIATLLDTTDPKRVPGPAVALFREIADSSRVAPLHAITLLPAASEWTARAVNDELVQAGAWLEAARLAAVARDTGFFRTPSNVAKLRELTGASALPVVAKQRLHRTDSALTVSTPDWPAIRAELDAALRVLGASGG